MAALFSSSKVPVPMEGGGPRLDLSGPILKRAFETLVAGTEDQGGVEQWIDALKLKSRMIQQAFGQGHPADLPLDTFKSLCAFMSSVRRRVGPYLEQPAWSDMVPAIAELVESEGGGKSVDERMAAYLRVTERADLADLATERAEFLVADPEVDVISFTGSTAVGRQIASVAGQRLAKVSLELGGKNPLVVCDDADLDTACKWALLSAFSNAGQSAFTPSWIAAVDEVYDELVEKAGLDRLAFRSRPDGQ